MLLVNELGLALFLYILRERRLGLESDGEETFKEVLSALPFKVGMQLFNL
jgi:hypothetical protein